MRQNADMVNGYRADLTTKEAVDMAEDYMGMLFPETDAAIHDLVLVCRGIMSGLELEAPTAKKVTIVKRKKGAQA
tara:strand:- start:247 stop:471 length:225 start_codon:yes stop_codon:yes gene_type:complete